ncbi:hypothetical protein KIH41_15770 [Litoribacter ruber]|uniref:Uncharacterized protein n=1 Tax=Litoribacter ruber TaxID=702568 RepID=A0AAP2CMY1_9BACT|nr:MULTISPECIES: hypothetical protein [Litoribacter]MBS9524727.1 hypothetical protein [Litoribacter alkaliphilus]MBT0812747.1 hypothetical protein [Litoribacter ruber]
METHTEQQSKIRITSKKLASGNHQVKFFIEDEKHPQYGYLLVTGSRSVGEVIEEIKNRIAEKRKASYDLQRFSFSRNYQDDHNFYLYSA